MTLQLFTLITQDDGFLPLETALMTLDTSIRKVVVALMEKDAGDVNDRPLLKNTIAKNSSKIRIYLRDNDEEHGMNVACHEALIKHCKCDRIVYMNLFALGDFNFVVKSCYCTQLIVIAVGNGRNIQDSHIPLGLLSDLLIVIAAEDIKKKSRIGSGIINYKSARTAVVNKKNFTHDLVLIFDISLVEHNETNKQTKEKKIHCRMQWN